MRVRSAAWALTAGCVLLTLLSLAREVCSEPIYEASAGITNFFPVLDGGASPVSVSISGSPNPGTSASAAGRAGVGFVGARAEGSSPGGSFVGAQAAASVIFPITIGGPSGASGPVSFRLSLDGSFSTTPQIPRSGLAGLTIAAGLRDPVVNIVAGTAAIDCLQFAGCQTIDQVGAGGLLTGYSGGPKEIRVDLGDTAVGSYLFALSIDVRTNGGTFESPAHSVADYFGTLTFPTSGLVFSLPDGFTVNAPDAGIFDNQFLGGEVPEPATLVLLGSTLAGIGLAQWRRSRQRG